MSKSWMILIALAVISMIALMVYEFYQSASGANTTFVPKYENTLIRSDLGSGVLDFVSQLESSVEVKDDQVGQPVNAAVTPTPTVTEDFAFPVTQP